MDNVQQLINSLPPAPVVISGNSLVDWIACTAAIYGAMRLAAYWIKAAHLARESLMAVAANASLAFFAWLFVTALVNQSRPFDPSMRWFPWIAAAVIFILKSAVARSRYIPAGVKRAVIARDLKGEPFDKDKYQFDHIWPFHLGGSNTVDNLRIIPRMDNQRKGRRRPTWDEIFGGDL
ncbi:MAG: HNH endonuclease signature motif containing protein [Rhizomicrobium sp.]